MKVLEALTMLVVGMSRLGDHLLSRKFSGAVVATAAFALGLGAWSLWPRTAARPACAAPLVVEVRNETGQGKFDSFEYETCRGEARVESRYENNTYGYSVELPRGMVGAGAPPPAPNHGFGIDLDSPHSTDWNTRPDFPKSYLTVDGSYNSLEWKLLDDAVKSQLSFLREQGTNVRVQSRGWTNLGGLRAARIVSTFEKGGEEMVSEEVVAFRREPGGAASVVYTIDLSTTLANYERDRPVLDELRRSWHLQPPR